MRIVVSDTSCLIDLRKVSLLDTFLKLPYEVQIPNTLFEDELQSFSDNEKQALVHGGLRVIDLPGQQVLRAQEVGRKTPHLSVHDTFAFALAESCPGCILLTGDNKLRALGKQHGVEVHGILWAVDELHRNQLATAAILLTALQLFANDSTVRLPRHEVAAHIRRYQTSEVSPEP